MSVCARANGVSSGASSCASDQNGRYYIAVEPRRAAMALQLVGGDYWRSPLTTKIQGACRRAAAAVEGSARRAQRMQHAVVTWSEWVVAWVSALTTMLYSKKVATYTQCNIW